MTKNEAIAKAIRLSKSKGRDYYVIRSNEDECDGDFHVATEIDLDTYFAGCGDPVFCTADAENY